MCRIVRVLLLVIVLPLGSEELTAQSAPQADYRIVSSDVVGPNPPLRVVAGSQPKIAQTSWGCCVAWTRSDGAVIASRTDRDGELLEPAGTWLGPGHAAAVIPTTDGCLVLSQTHRGQTVGVFLQESGSSELKFELPGPVEVLFTAPGRFIAREPPAGELREYDSDGHVVGRLDLHAIGAPYLIAVIEVDGRTVFVGSNENSERQVFDITNLSQPVKVGVLEENIPLSWTALLVGAIDGDLLVVGEPYQRPAIWVRYTLDGHVVTSGEISRAPVDDPADLGMEIVLSNRVRRILAPDLTRAADFPFLTGSAMDFAGPVRRRAIVSTTADRGSDGAVSLRLQHREWDRTVVSWSSPRQVLVDTAVHGDQIAMLWVETEEEPRLSLAMFDTSESKFLWELDVTDDVQAQYAEFVAGVEISDGIVLVVWPESDALHARRAWVGGKWLENPRELVTGGLLGSEESLAVIEGGFELGYRTTTGYALARIERDGSVDVRDVVLEEMTVPLAISSNEDGPIVAGMVEVPCRMTCPPQLVGNLTLDVFDPNGNRIHDLVDDRPEFEPFGVSRNVELAVGQDSMLVTGSYFPMLFRRLGPFIWSQPELITADADVVIWDGERYVLAGWEFDHQTQSSSLMIGDFRPDAPRPVTLMKPLLTGRRGEGELDLRQVGDRLFLISTMISDDPEHHFVPRLHVMELERRDTSRRRLVR